MVLEQKNLNFFGDLKSLYVKLLFFEKYLQGLGVFKLETMF